MTSSLDQLNSEIEKHSTLLACSIAGASVALRQCLETTPSVDRTATLICVDALDAILKKPIMFQGTIARESSCWKMVLCQARAVVALLDDIAPAGTKADTIATQQARRHADEAIEHLHKLNALAKERTVAEHLISPRFSGALQPGMMLTTEPATPVGFRNLIGADPAGDD